MGDSILDAHRDVVEYLGGPVPVIDVVLTEQELDAILPDSFCRSDALGPDRVHSHAELDVVVSGSSHGIILRPQP